MGGADAAPEAPAGHRGPFEYETSDLVPAVLQIVLFVVLMRLFFPELVSSYVAFTPFTWRDAVAYLLRNRLQVAGFLGFVVVMTVVHEYIHYVADRWCGLDPEFGFRSDAQLGMVPIPDPYVVAKGDFIDRRADLVALGSPVVVMAIVALCVLVLPTPPAIDYLARVVLVLNTSASGYDIYNMVTIWRMDPGTLLYNYETAEGIGTVYYPPEK